MNTFSSLLRRGLDDNLAKTLVDSGYTIGKLKSLKNDKLKALGLNSEQITSINKGNRPPIPEDTFIKILYESKRTCCVCRDPSKPLIIHHIDEWNISKSHDENNLVVLCLEHHDQAHTKKELSINLSKKQLLAFKDKWVKETRTKDANAILGLASNDFSRWDYFNHTRIYELFLDLDIDVSNFKTFEKLHNANWVDKLGVLNTYAIQHENKNESYMYRDGHGIIFTYYMKELFEATLQKLPIIDITDKFDRKHIRSLLFPGTFISLQAGFYYK